MEALGVAAPANGRAYFAGGETAVLMGWRGSTIDVDLKFVPEQDAVFRAIRDLKEKLRINVELAALSDFIQAPRAGRSGASSWKGSDASTTTTQVFSHSRS